MRELDLVLVNETDNCTVYSIQFLSEDESEFERFYNKFKDDAEYNPDLMRIVAFINKIATNGAFELTSVPRVECQTMWLRCP